MSTGRVQCLQRHWKVLCRSPKLTWIRLGSLFISPAVGVGFFKWRRTVRASLASVCFPKRKTFVWCKINICWVGLHHSWLWCFRLIWRHVPQEIACLKQVFFTGALALKCSFNPTFLAIRAQEWITEQQRGIMWHCLQKRAIRERVHGRKEQSSISKLRLPRKPLYGSRWCNTDAQLQ